MHQEESENVSETESVAPKGTAKKLLGLVLTALLICNVFVLFNVIVVSYFISDAVLAVYMISLITLLEGGIGLVLGGFFVIGAGPSVTKISEKVLHGPPYSARRARDAEANARVIFFFSLFLIISGFAIPFVLA